MNTIIVLIAEAATIWYFGWNEAAFVKSAPFFLVALLMGAVFDLMVEAARKPHGGRRRRSCGINHRVDLAVRSPEAIAAALEHLARDIRLVTRKRPKYRPTRSRKHER